MHVALSESLPPYTQPRVSTLIPSNSVNAFAWSGSAPKLSTLLAYKAGARRQLSPLPYRGRNNLLSDSGRHSTFR